MPVWSHSGRHLPVHLQHLGINESTIDKKIDHRQKHIHFTTAILACMTHTKPFHYTATYTEKISSRHRQIFDVGKCYTSSSTPINMVISTPLVLEEHAYLETLRKTTSSASTTSWCHIWLMTLPYILQCEASTPTTEVAH